MSYVSQDDYLLDGTLLDNIRMVDDATEEEAMAAAQAASCEEFIKRLPQGWDTPSGEAGGCFRVVNAKGCASRAPF